MTKDFGNSLAIRVGEQKWRIQIQDEINDTRGRFPTASTDMNLRKCGEIIVSTGRKGAGATTHQARLQPPGPVGTRRNLKVELGRARNSALPQRLPPSRFTVSSSIASMRFRFFTYRWYFFFSSEFQTFASE